MTHHKQFTHFHLFCGLGGAAKGFNRANSRVKTLSATWRCIGGIDVDAAGIRDFERAAGVPGTVRDLFDREQYTAFHGHEPPPGWVEATPEDIRRAAGYEVPDCCVLSAPCKGFSGLLSESKSKTDKYQALNRLTLRGIWLMLEAWVDNPPSLIVFENVPRIATRGRPLLDRIISMLRHYGYAVAETTHDCGELGGLAQSRKRFLLVARLASRIPNYLYQPESQPLRAVGDVLGRMPLPGDPRGGPMHRIPALHWKTWLRLAFVEPGSDWRSLNRLAVEDGHLRDYLIVPQMHHGMLGVRAWDEHTGAVTGQSRVSNGAFAIADHRFQSDNDYGQYGVCEWERPMGAVINVKSPGQGKFAVADPRPHRVNPFGKYSVADWDGSTGTVIGGDDSGAYAIADPRMSESANRQYNLYKVVRWDRPSNVVAGSAHVGGGALSVSDPRNQGPVFGKYAVTEWTGSAGSVISNSTSGQGAFAVADPRSGMERRDGDAYLTGGHYGVLNWQQASGAVSASANHDNGRWSVADPRACPAPNQNVVAIIQSLDGTWHRPFTTLELAALQSLVDPEEVLELDGLSDQAWRERIGNAIPPSSAEAIAQVMGDTLLANLQGETFILHSQPVWVRPMATALTVASQV